MARRHAFRDDNVTSHPVQGEVVYVGVSTVDVKTGGTILRNVSVGIPLTIEDITNHDIVELSWRRDTPRATSILGHETALKRDMFEDTTPPNAPINVKVIQGPYGARLSWNFVWVGQSDLAYFEVDARKPGGDWGYKVYPVEEGTRVTHYPLLPGEPVQCRVRSVDLRGNKSAWVVCSDLLVDLVAPPAPTGFTVTNEAGGVRLRWATPIPGTIPDLAGFFIYADTNAAGTGSPTIVKTVGQTTETFYSMYWGTTKYFNIKAFDLAGNESDYAEELWLEGTSLIGQGIQLLSNADWERDRDSDGVPDDWYVDADSGSSVTLGAYGWQGGQGQRFSIADGEYAYAAWGYSISTPGCDKKLPIEAGQTYTWSVYYYTTDTMTPIVPALDGSHLNDGEAAIAIVPELRTENGAGGVLMLSGEDSYEISELEDGWKRIAITHKITAAEKGSYAWLGARVLVVSEYGSTITVDVDRPQLEMGTLSEWKPGVIPPGGGSVTGLLIDLCGIKTSDDVFWLADDGYFYSHLLPAEDSTYNLGSSSKHWATVYADNLVGSAAHDPVSLAADAQELLNLSSQDIGLESQGANEVLAGPASGGDADPTFRALVDADIPAAIARDSEVTSAISTHAADDDAHHDPVTGGDGITVSTQEVAVDLDGGAHDGLEFSSGKLLCSQATTSARGSVELATDGENAANVVVQGNDSRLLTSTQKTDLTDNGLTTLHDHHVYVPIYVDNTQGGGDGSAAASLPYYEFTNPGTSGEHNEVKIRFAFYQDGNVDEMEIQCEAGLSGTPAGDAVPELVLGIVMEDEVEEQEITESMSLTKVAVDMSGLGGGVYEGFFSLRWTNGSGNSDNTDIEVQYCVIQAKVRSE